MNNNWDLDDLVGRETAFRTQKGEVLNLLKSFLEKGIFLNQLVMMLHGSTISSWLSTQEGRK